MNRLIYKISLLILVLAFTGCKKEFLELEPTGSQLPKDTYLRNNEEVLSALIGVYDVMQFNYSHGGWASVYFMKNLPADDVLCAGGGPTDQSEYQDIDDFKIIADNSKIETIWFNFYKAINSCNTIINVVAGKENATDEMKSIAAEAKALRALNYFDLVVMFGDVPFFTENPVNTDDFHKPRTAKAEVYAQIEKDLKDAIALLPLKSELSASHKFRFAKGAAQGLLGKVYLYQQGKESEAVSVLSDVISSGEYSLENDFSDVWAATNEFGVESMFEISYVSTEAYDWGNFPWGGGNESNIEAQLEGPRDVVFDLSNTSLDVRNGWGFNLPSGEIGDLFVAEGKGPRYEGTLISAADLIATGGAIKPPPAGESHHDYEGYMRLKYVTKASETDMSAVGELNYTVNWRILRYADVLLLAAEAYHLSGDDVKAKIELNKVRDRAGLADVTATGAALFDAIKKERQMELAFEGQRYWDLVRWGDANAEMSDIGFVAGKHEVFPIPQNEIIANNALTDADQNPGY